VTGFAERRGDATAARALCEDLTPPAPPAPPAAAVRSPGASRPSKRDRRAIDRFTRTED
jgi:ribosome-associated heat shock protein Hsp15